MLPKHSAPGYSCPRKYLERPNYHIHQSSVRLRDERGCAQVGADKLF